MSYPLLSIGVPVYNVEKYLQKCLDSLINQTLRDIEIIIVNDGSTDSSGEICKEYEQKDTRIRLINKENGGLASARQAALEASTGLYFCACDADDWVEPTMYEVLYQQAKESRADIVMCNYWSEYGEGERKESLYLFDTAKVEDYMDEALNGRFPCQVWNKMFKREIFEKYSISWKAGINLGEDFLLMLKLFQYPVTISFTPKALYHYRRELGGISYTNNVTMNTFNQSLYIRKWVMSNVDSKKYANGVFRLWLSLAFTGLRVRDGMDSQYFRQQVMKHLPLYGFVKYRYPLAKGCLVLFTKFFGVSLGRSIYKAFYKYVYK